MGLSKPNTWLFLSGSNPFKFALGKSLDRNSEPKTSEIFYQIKKHSVSGEKKNKRSAVTSLFKSHGLILWCNTHSQIGSFVSVVCTSPHCQLNCTWLQDSKAKKMRTALFWFITQRVVVTSCRRFGTTFRFHLQGSRSQKKTVQFVIVLPVRSERPFQLCIQEVL